MQLPTNISLVEWIIMIVVLVLIGAAIGLLTTHGNAECMWEEKPAEAAPIIAR